MCSRSQPVSVIEAAVETVTPGGRGEGHQARDVARSRAGPISGDPGRLQQVVWNLLSNAIKFTPKDGKVQIVLERVNSHIEISVADTGVGIKPELIPHVFERFRQADASTTRRHGGLGLGLSIVKSLVELHGGTVSVRSAGEGQGTTVTVILPLMVVHRKETPASVSIRRPSRRGAPRFVTAELAGPHSARGRRFEPTRAISSSGCWKTAPPRCSPRLRVDEALVLVESEKPDVLITDIGMPDADGFELLKRVRALGPDRGGKVPAIALTAFARSEIAREPCARAFWSMSRSRSTPRSSSRPWRASRDASKTLPERGRPQRRVIV